MLKTLSDSVSTLRLKPLAVAVAGCVALSGAAWAEETTATATPAATTTQGQLEEVVVIADTAKEPLKVETDPKAPQQPLPAHDGADYLKTIPGFSVTRKGGTDGDPAFRGMAGSRLGVLIDGASILGGCNGRMDAPTAYIYPELYDALTVVKGPQSVRYGAGNSAATVLFERKIPRFDEAGVRFHGSVLGASADRADVLADVQAGNRLGYVQLTGSDSTANDYEDGDGRDVHSQYHRYSGNAALGWTPDENTRLELSGMQSDGEAAYADRSMDGTRFRRDSGNLRFEKKNLSRWVESVEAQVYDNRVDHIMDDQELRDTGMMAMGYANLTRDTTGGRVASTLAVTGDDSLTLGVDTQSNEHRSRSAPVSHVYTAWADDANIDQIGLFAELEHRLNPQDRLLTGYRSDQWEATDERQRIRTSMMMSMANPTANATRENTLGSGFLRMEHDLAQSPTTLYAGYGESRRFPDYWELIAKQGETSLSAFDIAPETTRQLDLGLLHDQKDLDVSLSLFYSDIRDFILIDYSNPMKSSGFSRNVEARTYGGELGLGFPLDDFWKLDTAVAYTWGENQTDRVPLAQIAPMETRVGLSYVRDTWSLGGLLRVVDSQDRFDPNGGSIVGRDLGPTDTFGVVSLNGQWKPTDTTLLSAGVDNLFDRAYAEFISRAGADVMGFVQTERVNEPGRTLWLKAEVTLD